MLHPHFQGMEPPGIPGRINISMSGSPLSNHADPISVLIAQFQQLHSELLLEVANRDDESLNWTPCPGGIPSRRLSRTPWAQRRKRSERSPEYLVAVIEMPSSKWAGKAGRTCLTRFAMPNPSLANWHRCSQTTVLELSQPCRLSPVMIADRVSRG